MYIITSLHFKVEKAKHYFREVLLSNCCVVVVEGRIITGGGS